MLLILPILSPTLEWDRHVHCPSPLALNRDFSGPVTSPSRHNWDLSTSFCMDMLKRKSGSPNGLSWKGRAK